MERMKMTILAPKDEEPNNSILLWKTNEKLTSAASATVTGIIACIIACIIPAATMWIAIAEITSVASRHVITAFLGTKTAINKTIQGEIWLKEQ